MAFTIHPNETGAYHQRLPRLGPGPIIENGSQPVRVYKATKDGTPEELLGVAHE